ncbi:dihydrodipicolinate synthase family protein [Clostridium sp. C105KSO13]|uniref:dihydrodipicolinate synthase family protein n=1 Tax=Clostridium sp. C105KSO13 TaxID=1776045 RepID=UPI0007408236|nr:dihydrodipicolinate synthase family protein [Clostridium sp. C105KSO13]CUX17350.1 4-hydroxy-tetrahydrodipicolinate synthase [Clostridium sp. C105KSO13]
MNKEFPKGVYPVMLTPFTEDNKVDYKSLGRLVDWYIQNKAAGLFADCQSSEMFYLSFEERVEIARFVKARAAGRVPVVASGHVSDSLENQAKELTAVAETGVDAVILLTNRLAAEAESDEVWLENLKKLMIMIPEDIPLGFYECPYPYKRIISPELLKWCADTGRFYFIKDTSCDLTILKEKLEQIKGSQLQLFNANTSTLLETLRLGCSGFSGVMANFHPDLYTWLCSNFEREPEKARQTADFLTVASLIERQIYPVNAKYFQKEIGNFCSIYTRTKDVALLNDTAKSEINQLTRLTECMREKLDI